MDNTYKRDKDFLKMSYNVKSVARGCQYWSKYLLSRCQNILIFQNLPDTLLASEIMKSILIKGNATVVKENGKYYCPFTGHIYYTPYKGNVPDVFNRFTYSAPGLKGGNGLEDRKTCAIIFASDLNKTIGGSIIFETIQRYSRMLADLESTFINQLVYSRPGVIAQAANTTAGQGLDMMLSRLENGEVSSILNKTMPLDSIKFEQFGGVNSFTWFTEARDYLINSFMTTIGMSDLEEKKERMISDELSFDDSPQNNIDILYKSVYEGIQKVNETFGLDIKVYKNSITGSDTAEESFEESEEVVEYDDQRE